MDRERASELIQRWQEFQDHDALDELLRDEVDTLAKNLRARTGGRIDGSMSAADLAQEAALRLVRLDEMPHFEDARQLRRYLWNAAWRLFLNRAQRPGHAVVHVDVDASRALGREFARTGGLGATDDSDQRLALQLAINLMKPEDREVLERVYFSGQAIDDAASDLGLNRAAFDMRLTRARRRLAERLVDWGDVIA
jgi:RNA polymerase sigma factor (sigma-70 family)